MKSQLLETEIKKEKINKGALLKIAPILNTLKISHNHPAHRYNVINHTIKVVEGVPREVFIRLVALCHDLGKGVLSIKVYCDRDTYAHFWGHEKESARLARQFLEEFGYDKKLVDNVVKIVEVHDTKIEPTEAGVKAMVDYLGRELFEQLLILQRADLLAHSKRYIDRKMPILIAVNKIYEEMYKN